MPTNNVEKPSSRILFRVVYWITGVFAVVVVVLFLRSAPARSPEMCALTGGRQPKPDNCLQCHVNPHVDGEGYHIRRVDAETGVIETVEINGHLRHRGIVAGPDGSTYGVSPLEHVAWRQRPDEPSPSIIAGVVIRGKAVSGFSGDGEAASAARLNRPSSIALDAAGLAYIADTLNNRVRRINGAGVIETIAGNGETGFDGDGGRAIDAAIDKPLSLAFDGDGDLLIAHSDGRQGRVREFDATTGTITTIAGGGSPSKAKGDGGPATEATLKRPVEVTVDSETGDVYIAESRPVLRHWNIGKCGFCHGLP